jgi:hypothetical protein
VHGGKDLKNDGGSVGRFLNAGVAHHHVFDKVVPRNSHATSPVAVVLHQRENPVIKFQSGMLLYEGTKIYG